MFEIISSLLRFIFVVIIYLFVYGVIRLIYLDIRSIKTDRGALVDSSPYLKLVNRKDSLFFKVEESYVLDKSKTIGRSNKNEIAAEDPFLSAKHAEFAVRNGQVYLKDMESKNGTFVNGKGISGHEVYLREGDRIKAGQLEFLFVENSSKLEGGEFK